MDGNVDNCRGSLYLSKRCAKARKRSQIEEFLEKTSEEAGSFSKEGKKEEETKRLGNKAERRDERFHGMRR